MIKDPRWRSFLRNRRAVISLIIVAVLAILSCGAELLANSVPLVLSTQGKIYFPVLKTYSGREFGLDSPVEPEYKKLQLSEGDWAVWPPIRWGYNESNIDLESFPSEPSPVNLLGTDDRGRDLLARLIYGFRVSMAFGLANLLIAIVIAVIVGGLQGYFGGLVDFFGQRTLEIWSALPYLYVLVLLISIFQPGIGVLILAEVFFVWINLSYYVRAEYLKLRNLDFVLAAENLGASSWRIIGRHIFPNSLTPIVTFAPFILGQAIVDLAMLDYLGLGVPAPTASLGELLRQGRQYFMNSWWLAVYPFGALVGTMIMLNFIGEGVREAFDPRKARR